MKDRFKLRLVRPKIVPLNLEKGIPIPPNPNDTKGLYPFDKMKIGDSFFAPGKTTTDLCRRSLYWSARLGTRYVSRMRRENEVMGTRCWRIE